MRLGVGEPPHGVGRGVGARWSDVSSCGAVSGIWPISPSQFSPLESVNPPIGLVFEYPALDSSNHTFQVYLLSGYYKQRFYRGIDMF